MSVSLGQLYRMQQMDIKIAELNMELETLASSALPEELEYEKMQLQLKQLLNRVEVVKKEERLKELELAGLQAEKQKIESKLYSGTTINAKELSQWQRDFELSGSKIGALEENILSKLIEREELDAEIRGYSLRLDECKNVLDTTRNNKMEKVKSIEHTIVEWKEKREKVFANIDDELYSHYEQLMEKKGGIVVAKIQADVCEGCFVLLPESLIKRVQGRELQHCPQCCRILYWEAETK